MKQQIEYSVTKSILRDYQRVLDEKKLWEEFDQYLHSDQYDIDCLKRNIRHTPNPHIRSFAVFNFSKFNMDEKVNECRHQIQHKLLLKSIFLRNLYNLPIKNVRGLCEKIEEILENKFSNQRCKNSLKYFFDPITIDSYYNDQKESYINQYNNRMDMAASDYYAPGRGFGSMASQYANPSMQEYQNTCSGYSNCLGNTINNLSLSKQNFSKFLESITPKIIWEFMQKEFENGK